MNKTKRQEIFTRLVEAIPEPTTELHYGSTFELLIAVILSAQATDVGVNKATKALFKDAPTPEKMAALGVEKLKTYIKTIGLFNTKAVNVIKTCHDLVQLHNSVIPHDRKALEALCVQRENRWLAWVAYQVLYVRQWNNLGKFCLVDQAKAIADHDQYAPPFPGWRKW